MGLSKRKENEKYTYGDYLQWPDSERWELIDGKAYNMSPAPSVLHQRISRELLKHFAVYLTGKTCEVFHAPFDVRFPAGEEKDEDTKTVVQPDIVVICDKSKIDHRGCKGAPNLVIEITSPGTCGNDKKIKRDIYEKHGVKEYWIVDPEPKIVEVYRLNDNKLYDKPEVYLEKDFIKVGIFQDLIINLQEVFI